MRALLDVNVLVALLDTEHVYHRRARAWLEEHQGTGWASSPMTQNGCLRVLSLEGYPRGQPVRSLAMRLAEAAKPPTHEFWPDDVSLLDPSRVTASRIHGPRQVTDVYLLALAVKHSWRFVTLDGRVPLSAVVGAEAKHLVNLLDPPSAAG